MGDVDGHGVLEMGSAGTATWLIIPYSEAAPTEDVQYDIGGTLYYTVGGQNISIPLFPETITVTPDPRLYLNYFLERNVRSDDAMTEGILDDVVEVTFVFILIMFQCQLVQFNDDAMTEGILDDVVEVTSLSSY